MRLPAACALSSRDERLLQLAGPETRWRTRPAAAIFSARTSGQIIIHARTRTLVWRIRLWQRVAKRTPIIAVHWCSAEPLFILHSVLLLHCRVLCCVCRWCKPLLFNNVWCIVGGDNSAAFLHSETLGDDRDRDFRALTKCVHRTKKILLPGSLCSDFTRISKEMVQKRKEFFQN